MVAPEGEPSHGSDQWPPLERISLEWPQLGRIGSAVVVGSGLRLQTDAGAVHLKRRPRRRIRAEVWTLDQLHHQGVPVTVPISTRTGASHLTDVNDAWFCYHERPGRALCRRLEAPGEAEFAAATCARLSESLARLDLTTAVVEGMPLRPATAATAGLARQVIHRDFHAGNVLVDADADPLALAGLLDFDHLEIGPRIVDLVYLAGSVLAELSSCGHPERFLPQWQRLVHGYCSVSRLSAPEAALTGQLLIEVEADFESWFRETGDLANAQLTAQLIDWVDRHHQQVVEIASQAAAS